jgi:hypothetical protein
MVAEATVRHRRRALSALDFNKPILNLAKAMQ